MDPGFSLLSAELNDHEAQAAVWEPRIQLEDLTLVLWFHPIPHQGLAKQKGVPGYLCCCAGQFQLWVCPGLHVPSHSCAEALF